MGLKSGETSLLPEPSLPEDCCAWWASHTRGTPVALPQRLDGLLGLLLPSWGLASQRPLKGGSYPQQAQAGEKQSPSPCPTRMDLRPSFCLIPLL